ncbi:MAG TPA: FAD binding domain-containing protein [Actinomycetota bacterium]|nr:FAD binding domain-containing protein [Actinomycetota bacterium]
MKPPPFTYHRAETRDELDDLLARLGDDAKVLAGGQSLLPVLNMRLASPAHLVDVNFLRDEPAEPRDAGDAVTFGPLVRQAAAERSELVARRAPLVHEALQFVAHPAIRSRGTVCGSVAHADPAAELPAVMTALDATVTARSARGTRSIAAREFFVGPFATALEPGEWVEEVRVPAQTAGTGWAFEEFARRAGDYALCGVAAVAPAQGVATLAYLGVTDTPMRVNPEADDEDALRAALADVDVAEDIHATSRYRSHLAVKLGARALQRARHLAREGTA